MYIKAYTVYVTCLRRGSLLGTGQAVRSEMAEVKERQHFLDVLRAAAACAVVLLHTITGVMDTTDMSQYLLE